MMLDIDDISQVDIMPDISDTSQVRHPRHDARYRWYINSVTLSGTLNYEIWIGKTYVSV